VSDAAAFSAASSPELKGIFYENAVSNGEKTQVFAWLGIPNGVKGKVPAVVLVHGGGGTAFRYWAKLWLKRGYAVIAMDHGGGIPQNNGDSGADKSIPHSNGGPRLQKLFASAMLPAQDQWAYHAVSAIIRANSLLRSIPEVDSGKIGLIGISWGGFASEIALGIDGRFQYGIIVYANGFLHENSLWKDTEFKTVSDVAVKRWTALWDPSNYLGKSNLPILFVNGAADPCFRPDVWQKTYRLIAPGNRNLVYRTFMPHGHPPAGEPDEIAAFASSMTQSTEPLPQIISQSDDSIVYESALPLQKAELCYTVEHGAWNKRKWQTVPLSAGAQKNSIKFNVPMEATAYFINLYDHRNLIASGEMIISKKEN
jgi:cephalosporin-C deacetylase-like acetyl esterase